MSSSKTIGITRRSFIEKSVIGTAGLTLGTASAGFASSDPGHDLSGLKSIDLDPPDINRGIPVMNALKNRRSIREIQSKKLPHYHLSNLLWASDGVNREDGKRTAPSAMNLNITEIYALLEEGIYFYDHENHRLVQKVSGDFRILAGEQDFIKDAPLDLVYIANLEKAENPERSFPTEQVKLWAAIEAGHQSQNVYLYCASEGLGTVIRAGMNEKEFCRILNFSERQIFIANQTIGYRI